MDDEASQRTRLLSALATEHFVLQSATSTTYSEASARSTLYVMALSSSLVAMGFLSSSKEAFVPFLATVLPALFLLGLFTVVRLVETGLESMQYLAGIARIRRFYRTTLGPDAAVQFAAAAGRWPEVASPATRFGDLLGFLGTTASMIAVINNVVVGAAVALLVHSTGSDTAPWLAPVAGVACALVLTWAFVAYQRLRFAEFDATHAADAQR